MATTMKTKKNPSRVSQTFFIKANIFSLSSRPILGLHHPEPELFTLTPNPTTGTSNCSSLFFFSPQLWNVSEFCKYFTYFNQVFDTLYFLIYYISDKYGRVTRTFTLHSPLFGVLYKALIFGLKTRLSFCLLARVVGLLLWLRGSPEGLR